MKISLSWLNEFVDLSDLAPEKVAEHLSLHTAEVEGVEVFGAAIADVVVGHVVECGRHPDADKLSVTRVKYGADAPAEVVCGAPNVRQGLKVAFAPVGCTLPGGLKIKKAKLRGQVSCGMICSARELELSEEHDGILELEDDAPVGARLVDHLELLDAVLELDNKSLTHRPDLWGHYGFARELAAILGRELRPLPVREAWDGPAAEVPITLEDPEACPLYLGLRVDLDGPPRPSPTWLQRRLLAVGQRPLNDLVDLTNYLLHEIGQPTHAFDLACLEGPEIRVRRAAAGERFTTLDEVERELTAEDLVIADGGRAVALAGVMGGANSEVGDSTGSILLESAVFQPVRVRRTAKRLNLRSEASARFEKSLDPALAEQALRRFAVLLERVRPEARVVGAPASAGSAAAPVIDLELDPARTAELLSLDLDRGAVGGSLRALGFGVEDSGQGPLSVRVPSWRATKDVTTPIDLVEEVGRLSGYHRIQPEPLSAPVIPPWVDPVRELGRRLADRLAGAWSGAETQGYSFLDRNWAGRLGLEVDAFARLANPVQAGVDLVRRDPVPTLLEQAAGNVRERGAGLLFELAKGYEADAPTEEGLPRERVWLGAVLWQRKGARPDGPESVFGRARSLVEDLLRTAVVDGCAERDGAPPAWAHPARSLAWSADGRPLATSAAVEPRLAKALDLDGVDAAVALVDLAVLAELGADRLPSFRSPAKLPGIKVDVALALPAEIAYAEVETALRKAGGKLLERLELFDLFEGGSLPAGQRSLAFHALLRAADRTLEEKDERKFLQKVERAAQELGGSLRS